MHHPAQCHEYCTHREGHVVSYIVSEQYLGDGRRRERYAALEVGSICGQCLPISAATWVTFTLSVETLIMAFGAFKAHGASVCRAVLARGAVKTRIDRHSACGILKGSQRTIQAYGCSIMRSIFPTRACQTLGLICKTVIPTESAWRVLRGIVVRTSTT